MKREYYGEYFALEREHWWFRARRNILGAQVAWLTSRVPGRPRILNVGAALGASSDMLAVYGDVVSLEFDANSCAFVRREFGKTFINASVTELPFESDYFDLVCAFDVIEHVKDDGLAAREMIRVCKGGGCIAVTVPAFMMLWSHHDAVNEHYRRYRLPDLQRLFEPSGEVLFASYFNAILFMPIAGVRLLTKLLPTRWVRTGSGSDFSLASNGSIDALCYRVLNAENAWLRHRRSLPFGVSAYLAWRKR